MKIKYSPLRLLLAMKEENDGKRHPTSLLLSHQTFQLSAVIWNKSTVVEFVLILRTVVHILKVEVFFTFGEIRTLRAN